MVETAITEYGDFTSAISSEINVQSYGPRMARIMVAHGMSKAVKNRKAMIGQWIIDFKDEAMAEPIVAEDELRVWLLGGNYPGRVMWPKALGEEGTSPLCGSNDGVKPRDTFYESSFKDPRRQAGITLDAFTKCESCPLSQWVYEEREDGTKKAIPAPCSPTSLYVVWLVDYNMPAYFQSDSNFTRRPFDGGSQKKPKRSWTGIAEMMQGVDKLTGLPYFVRDNVPNAVLLTTEMYARGENEFPIPKLGWAPLTPEEFQGCKAAVAEYNTNKDRYLASLQAAEATPEEEGDTDEPAPSKSKEEEPTSAPW